MNTIEKNLSSFLLCGVAGLLAYHFGGWGAVGAAMIAQIGMGLSLTKIHE